MQDRNKELVLAIKRGENVPDNCQKLYYGNLGFITKIVRKYCIRVEDEPDLMQQAYLSLVKAIDSYDERKHYQFLTYLKVWLNHDFYEYNRNNHYSLSVPYKVYRDIGHSVCNAPITEPLDDAELCGATVSDFSTDVINTSFWESLRGVLSDIDYKIIYNHFYDSMSYAEIGRQLGLCRERVRVCARKSLEKIKIIM